MRPPLNSTRGEAPERPEGQGRKGEEKQEGFFAELEIIESEIREKKYREEKEKKPDYDFIHVFTFTGIVIYPIG